MLVERSVACPPRESGASSLTLEPTSVSHAVVPLSFRFAVVRLSFRSAVVLFSVLAPLWCFCLVGDGLGKSRQV